MNAQHSTLNAQRSSTSRVYDLEDRLLEYAVRVIRVTESMKRSAAGLHIADQLLRSGTSPYGNHGEAEGAESRDDFIHKLRICFKELRESRRWLKLIQRADLIDKPELLGSLINEADELEGFSLEVSKPLQSIKRRANLSVESSALSVESSGKAHRPIRALDFSLLQRLRSGTSPYGNHGEAEGAESRDDFIHKLRVCFKELRESRRWLKLIQRAELIDKPELLVGLINESDEPVRIFARSIQTATKHQKGGQT
jgi:four helix bundle protein